MGFAAVSGSGGEGGYLYTEERSEYGSHQMHPDPQRVWVYTQPQHRQTWRGADDSGLMRECLGPARFFIAEHERRWQAAGSPELSSGRHDTVFAPGCMETSGSLAPLARLPTDPTDLRAAIKRDPVRGRTYDEQDFLTVSNLLNGPGVPPRLCVALYRLALRLPAVQELGSVADRSGRIGRGIEMNADGYLRRLIFDRDSYRLLEKQETLTNPEYDYAPVGTVTGWTLFVEEKRVDALPDDAPPVPRPPCREGEQGVRRAVAPGLSHATGRPQE